MNGDTEMIDLEKEGEGFDASLARSIVPQGYPGWMLPCLLSSVGLAVISVIAGFAWVLFRDSNAQVFKDWPGTFSLMFSLLPGFLLIGSAAIGHYQYLVRPDTALMTVMALIYCCAATIATVSFGITTIVGFSLYSYPILGPILFLFINLPAGPCQAAIWLSKLRKVPTNRLVWNPAQFPPTKS